MAAVEPGVTQPSTARGAAAAAAPSPSLVQAAKDFESVFVGQLLHGMTVGQSSDSLLGNSGPLGGLLVDEYAKLISRSGGIGVADAVLKELMRMQEAA